MRARSPVARALRFIQFGANRSALARHARAIEAENKHALCGTLNEPHITESPHQRLDRDFRGRLGQY